MMNKKYYRVSTNQDYRASTNQTVVHRPTRLSCIDQPTIVYRPTKTIVHRPTRLSCIDQPDYRASTNQLSCIDQPRLSCIDQPDCRVSTNQDYRASTNQTVVYRPTRLSCIDQPDCRASTNQLSCIDQPTIVHRPTNYRASTNQGYLRTQLDTRPRATYPHPANLSLIYINPPARARGRERMHARERQPSVHLVHCAPTFRWPPSATPSGKRLKGVGINPSLYPTLPGAGQATHSVRFSRSALLIRKKKYGGRWRSFYFFVLFQYLNYAAYVYGLSAYLGCRPAPLLVPQLQNIKLILAFRLWFDFLYSMNLDGFCVSKHDSLVGRCTIV